MKEEKLLFVTCDLLRPLPPDVDKHVEDEGVKWITDTLGELEIKAQPVWQPVTNTDNDLWLKQEYTSEITEPYLHLFPTLLQSASCVVGWELPTGLRRMLEAEGILWVSFTGYLWGPRSDMLSVESSDPSLLSTIHRPIPYIQPTWNLDEDIRFSSLLIIEPPTFHPTRIHHGKVYTLNDCIAKVSEFVTEGKQIFVFPSLRLAEVESPALSLLGLRNIKGSSTLASVYVSSERTAAIASLDPSVAHLAQSFQKPFHCWNEFYPSSALIHYRDLKNRNIWQEILNRTRR